MTSLTEPTMTFLFVEIGFFVKGISNDRFILFFDAIPVRDLSTKVSGDN